MMLYNYRAIALSNAVSKILESVFLQHFKSNSGVDMYQFGFKAGHSTGQCTNLLKNAGKYYADSGKVKKGKVEHMSLSVF